MQVKKMLSTGFVMSLLFTALVIGGCAKGSKSNDVSLTNPNAATFQPKGTIQGKIRDAATLDPIVNAIVSVGLAVDVTDAQGQYILSNIPATTDGLNGTVSGHYDITVDLRSSTSSHNGTLMVNMGAPISASNPHYPQFAYRDREIVFTSLNDSTPCPDVQGNTNGVSEIGTSGNCGTNNTNHDTPVDGLVSNADLSVGKMDVTVVGTVWGCLNANVGDPNAGLPLANMVVELVTYNDSSNSGAGSSGNVVDSQTTDASGNFIFTNVEEGQSYQVRAVDNTANPTLNGWSSNFGTPGAAQTVSIANEPILACPNDQLGPVVISTSPENGSDQNPGVTDVVFNFSEDVAVNSLTSTTPGVVGGMIDHIVVALDGSKSGGPIGDLLPFTAAWTAANQLTVTLVTGASGEYHVTIRDIGNNITDVSGNGAQMGVCPDDGFNFPWGISNQSGSDNDCTVYFTTNGSAGVPAAPVVALLNGLTLDEGSGATTGVLDWLPVSAAKTYNVYCSTDEIFTDGTIAYGPSVLWDGVVTSNDNVDIGSFVEHISGVPIQVGLQYTCAVRGVNLDGVEGDASADVVIKDANGPSILAGNATPPCGTPCIQFGDQNGDGNVDTVVVYFNEPLNELTASVAGNYSLNIVGFANPAVNNARLLPSGDAVELTIDDTRLPGELVTDPGSKLTVANVTDLSGNVIRAEGDEYTLKAGAVQ